MPMYYLVIPFLKITGLARGLSQATIITLIMVTGIMAVLEDSSARN